MNVLLINQPVDYFTLLENDLSDLLVGTNDEPDLVHLFVNSRVVFEHEMEKLRPYYKRNPGIVIWVSWYKKTSKIPTDVTEDVIRNFALQNELVDVKVCAVSETWSGLKLVVPKKLR